MRYGLSAIIPTIANPDMARDGVDQSSSPLRAPKMVVFKKQLIVLNHIIFQLRRMPVQTRWRRDGSLYASPCTACNAKLV